MMICTTRAARGVSAKRHVVDRDDGRHITNINSRRHHVTTINGRSILKSAGMAVLICLSAVTECAASAGITTQHQSASSSFASSGVVQQGDSDGVAAVFLSSATSVFNSLWGDVTTNDDKKWMITTGNNRVLQQEVVVEEEVVVVEEDHDDHDDEGEEDHAADATAADAAAVEEDHAHEEDEHAHEGEEPIILQDVFTAGGDPITPLKECQGDCDSDSQCEGDLKCFLRDEFESVPGCSGQGLSGKDYCYHDDHDSHEEHDDHDEFSTSTVANNESKTTDEGGEPWGAVIGASLLVNLATFSGVCILIIPSIYRSLLYVYKHRKIPSRSNTRPATNGRFFDIIIPGFAVGALVATAVFLVLPESVKYLSGGGHASHAGEEAAAAGGVDDHSGHDDHRYLQEDSHAGEGSESSAAAKFGCSVLGGFLLPFVFSIIFHHSDPIKDDGKEVDASSEKVRASERSVLNEEEDCESCHGHDKSAADDVETGIALDGDERVDAPQDSSTLIQRVEDAAPEAGTSGVFVGGAVNETMPKEKIVNRRLCASILLGDSFHNFADGFFIAAAFRSCSVGVAISIMLVTLFHEIAQELADFIILTRYANLPVWKALAFNFISGLSVCLGGVVFLAATPGDTATGVILAMAGGVYINIAACETAPRMEGAMKDRSDRALMLFSIILGTIPLGLILLDHNHCG